MNYYVFLFSIFSIQNLLVVGVSAFSKVQGTVVTGNEQRILSGVTVVVMQTGRWTITDERGKFSIEVTEYPAVLSFSHLGMKPKTVQIEGEGKSLMIVLEQDNLYLRGVLVTAKRLEESTGSDIVLEKQAIDIVQAQSVADAMQLLPGKRVAESNLHERQILTMRSAIFRSATNKDHGLQSNYNDPHSINNSFGIGYLVDGMPLTNNVDLSGNRGVEYGPTNNATRFNSIGRGVDLRQISMENIESIEVVQGISSAKYGDHNTGLIKIKKATGYSPYRLRTTIRGGSYSVTLTKGLTLPRKIGTLNVGIDYLRAHKDPRYSLTKIDRVSLSTKWQYRKEGKFSNRLSLTYGQTIDQRNTEKNTFASRSNEVSNRRIRLSNQSTWYFDGWLIDELSGSAMIDYQANLTIRTQMVNSGGSLVPTSLVEGTYKADYSPANYISVEHIDSKPFTLFARMEAVKRLSIIPAKVEFGVSANIDNNYGEGTVFNPEQSVSSGHVRISNPNSVGWRPVNFNDLTPTDVRYSAYLLTDINSGLFSKEWKTSLGIRYENFNGFNVISPRINTRISLTKRLKLRMGFGHFSKAPSLQATFPFTTYIDYLMADKRTNKYSLALAHTLIRKYHNPDLRPSQTLKMECGIDYKFKIGNISLSAYRNKQYDGFTRFAIPEMVSLPELKFTYYPDRAPDWQVVGGHQVLLQNKRPVNGLITENYGAELLLNTRKIPSISTSFNLSAAYRHTITGSSLPQTITSKITDSFALIGYHEPSVEEYERLNSSITAIHHMQVFGLVVTLTAEQFILATSSKRGKGNYPFAYRDQQLRYHSIAEGERSDDRFAAVRRSGHMEETSTYIPKIYGNYHLKLSKEFSNGMKCSFYAVNFLNRRPVYQQINSNGESSTYELNRQISFGGSISVQF